MQTHSRSLYYGGLVEGHCRWGRVVVVRVPAQHFHQNDLPFFTFDIIYIKTSFLTFLLKFIKILKSFSTGIGVKNIVQNTFSREVINVNF
jgi:hypothetical protein